MISRGDATRNSGVEWQVGVGLLPPDWLLQSDYVEVPLYNTFSTLRETGANAVIGRSNGELWQENRIRREKGKYITKRTPGRDAADMERKCCFTPYLLPIEVIILVIVIVPLVEWAVSSFISVPVLWFLVASDVPMNIVPCSGPECQRRTMYYFMN
jgi:hypothetical protein